MRWSLVACGAGIVGVLAAAACKGGDSSGTKAARAAVVESGAISAEEDSLIERRNSLLTNRQRLRDERAKLAQEERRVSRSGGDMTTVEAKRAKLVEEEQGLDSEETDINGKLDELLAQRRAITSALAAGGSDKAGRVAAREAGVAEREKVFARREQVIAAREADLGKRERDLAKWKLEKCGVAAVPMTIIQTVDAKGSKYTKRDVEPLLSKARREMSKKGILRSDLPPAAQGLEKEATNAMGKGDYGRARFAAAQLIATIRSVKINRAFVAAKIGRLSARMKGRKLDASKQKSVDGLFRDATANYGDGRFSSANRRLNKIYSLTR